MQLTLTLEFEPRNTAMYRSIHQNLTELAASDSLHAHEGIGVRLYVNGNEGRGDNPWFQDDDMRYMTLRDDGTFALELEIADPQRFQYRYLVIYDVPLFKQLGRTWRHLASLVHVSELEQPMPTYFGNRVLPGNFTGGVHHDRWNLPTVASRKGPCLLPFRSLIVAADGRCTVCCVDDTFLLNVGNITHQSGAEILAGEKLRTLQQAHLEGNFQNTPPNVDGVPLCLLCQEWETPRLHPDQLQIITKDPTLLDRVEPCRKRIDLDDPELGPAQPPYLTFELSSRCNLNCRYCSQKNSELSCHSDMDFSAFETFLDGMVIQGTTVENINLFFRGESLLHPRFADFIRAILVRSKPRPLCQFIVLHTNLLPLTDDALDALLDAFSQTTLPCCGNLVVSLDAVAASTYRSLRGGDLNQAEANILRLLRARKQRGQFGPNLVLQFIVLSENAHEAGDFIAHWQEVLAWESDKPWRVSATLANQPGVIDGDVIYLRVDASPGRGDPRERMRIARDRYMAVVNELGLMLDESRDSQGTKFLERGPGQSPGKK